MDYSQYYNQAPAQYSGGYEQSYQPQYGQQSAYGQQTQQQYESRQYQRQNPGPGWGSGGWNKYNPGGKYRVWVPGVENGTGNWRRTDINPDRFHGGVIGFGGGYQQPYHTRSNGRTVNRYGGYQGQEPTTSQGGYHRRSYGHNQMSYGNQPYNALY